jgi:hypothetical protein
VRLLYRDAAFGVFTGGGDSRALTSVTLPRQEQQRIETLLEWVRRRR